MDDQKDRFGDKIHDLEKAREDQWAREQDRVLLEKIRVRQGTALRCPRCEAPLVIQASPELSVMACPNGHGAWLEEAALVHLGQKEITCGIAEVSWLTSSSRSDNAMIYRLLEIVNRSIELRNEFLALQLDNEFAKSSCLREFGGLVTEFRAVLQELAATKFGLPPDSQSI
jgi:hypothetical protein